METLTARLPQSLYSAKQIRDHEPVFATQLQLSMYQLMENAGFATWQLVEMYFTQLEHISCFCGKGNNGGDGYVVARLALEAGKQVTLYQMPTESGLQGDALTAQQAYLDAGGTIQPYHESVTLPHDTLIIDALLGTGISGALKPAYATWIEQINQHHGEVISIDVPSGLDADTGFALTSAVEATATVTFVAPKKGLFTSEGKHFSGRLWYAGLGIGEAFMQQITPDVLMLDDHVAPRRRHSHAHKGDFGHAFVIGGEPGMGGAVRLAAEAALRTGAGLVTVVTAIGNRALVSAPRPELMVKELAVAEHLGKLIEPATVLAFGPGAGQGHEAEKMLDTIVALSLPMVVDADGLNLLAKRGGHNSLWVLTPHPGEAARLLGCSSTDVNADRYKAARDIAQRYGGVCLLKGAGTVISDGEALFVNQSGNPGMATAGMGDTLTGIIVALLAQGESPIDAACQGATIHGAAADEAAKGGMVGMIASDVINQIRRVIND